jgi:hypothetical protein
MTPDTAQTLNFLQSDIGGAAVEVGVSILMFAAAFVILKTKVLPVWLAWVSFVLAVVALAGPIGFRLSGHGHLDTDRHWIAGSTIVAA